MELQRHWRPDHEVSSAAKVIVERVLSDPDAASRLARYYTVDSNYAGSTFVGLPPHDPYAVTAVDLLAVTTLSVTVHPRAIRSFAEQHDLLAEHLAGLDPMVRPEDADPAVVAEPMADLHEAVKQCLRRAGFKAATPG